MLQESPKCTAPHSHFHSGNALITPSNVINAIALAGNARKKHGTNPLQYPRTPSLFQIDLAASFHRRNFLSPSPSPFPNGSVMMRCLTTSDGYDVIQNTCAERPPAQKLMAGVESAVDVERKREMMS